MAAPHATDQHRRERLGERCVADSADVVGIRVRPDGESRRAGLGRRGQIRGIAGMMVPYPTLAAIGKWAAATYFMRGLTSFWVRRIIGLVRRFG